MAPSLGRGSLVALIIVGRVHDQGFAVKALWVGSQGGLLAGGRSECDLAGIHLFDEATGVYNHPFLPTGVWLILVCSED